MSRAPLFRVSRRARRLRAPDPRALVRAVLPATLLLALVCAPAGATTWYVDGSLGPGGNGLTWTTAFSSLAPALGSAVAGDQIWVTAGTYPAAGASFKMPVDTELYGGFLGGESSPSQRDLATNVTALDGGGANRVLAYTSTPTSATVVDGVHFVNGKAGDLGGGVYRSYDGSPVFRSCVFQGNTSAGKGGAVNMYSGAPVFIDCRFDGNQSVDAGGAMYAYEAKPRFERCVFVGNHAYGSGVYQCYTGAPLFLNSLFVANSSDAAGTSVYDTYAAAGTFLNCTLTSNTTLGAGTISDHAGNTIIRNTIVHGNTAGGTLPVAIVSAQVLDVGWSCIEGGYPGTGNLAVAPAFTPGGTFELQSPSPLIDAGNNTSVPAGATTDVHGNPRFADIANVPDTGVGPSPVVDIGAVETFCLSPTFTYGTGCPGTGFHVPLLVADPCPAIGGAFNLVLSDGLGGATAVLFAGVAQGATPINPSCSLLVSPVLPPLVALPLGGAGGGSGNVIIPVLVPPSMPAGLTTTLQFLIADPAGVGGLSASNGLSLTFY